MFYGWDTDVAITISGNNTTGIYSTSYYRLEYNSWSYCLFLRVRNVTVKNMQLKNTSANTYEVLGLGVSVTGEILDGSYNTLYFTAYNNIIIKTSGTGSCITTGGSNGALIYNNVCYGGGTGSCIKLSYVGVCYVYNNTCYGRSKGISYEGYAANTQVLKNNICYNNTNDYSFTATWGGNPSTYTTSNNLAKDTTSPDNDYDSSTLTFTNVGSGTEDFHLISSDTDAIDKGADLSGTFTTDIDGVTRTGTWDIGADEYVASGGGGYVEEDDKDNHYIMIL
jgi:hypothetical protein